MKYDAKVTYEGPFFTHDPSKTFGENMYRALHSTAQFGLKTVRELMPTVTGETRQNIRTGSGQKFATVEAAGERPVTFQRAFWLETGRRRREKSAGHQGIGVKWAKSAAKRSGELVYMRKSPPKPYHKAASFIRRKVLADVKAELLKGIEP